MASHKRKKTFTVDEAAKEILHDLDTGKEITILMLHLISIDQSGKSLQADTEDSDVSLTDEDAVGTLYMSSSDRPSISRGRD